MSRRSASWRSTPVSASWASRSSCRHADRSTDRCWVERIRAPACWSCCWSSSWPPSPSSGASPTGRSCSATRSPTRPIAQTTVRLEEPTRRGEIYDRSGTVVLATTVERDRLVAATDKLTNEQRRDDRGRARPDPGPRCRPGGGPPRQAGQRQGVHHPGARDRPDRRRPDPRGQRDAPDHGHLARARADAGLSPDRWQPGLVAGRPSPGLREPRRHGPVRRRAGVPGFPRRLTACGHRRA